MDWATTHPIRLTPGSKDEQRGTCSQLIDAGNGAFGDAKIPCGRTALDPIHMVINRVAKVRGIARPTKTG